MITSIKGANVGVSTNAILFYGYCWHDDDVEVFNRKDGDEREWQELLLAKRGEKDPWDAFPETTLRYDERRIAEDRWAEENRARLDDWSAKKKAVETEFGVTVSSHCSDECSMPFLAVSQSLLCARRGCPEILDVNKFQVDPTWKDKLASFVAEFAIELPQESPWWWLVSDWR